MRKLNKTLLAVVLSCGLVGSAVAQDTAAGVTSNKAAAAKSSVVKDLIKEISRQEYAERIEGLWLGQCIGNWTGLQTEGKRLKPPFFTDLDWKSETNKKGFDFVLSKEGDVWGADDDTDIEYIYQHLLSQHKRSVFTPEDIKQGWIKHIRGDEKPTYLWVSNARTWHLMKTTGMLPPETISPDNNRDYDQIDAQVTTEIFGIFAPERPDVSLKMAHLPIRTSAYLDAEWIS